MRLKFGAVLEHAKMGAKIRRLTWPTDVYICVKDNKIFDPNNQYLFVATYLSERDILAEDWEVVL